MYRRRTSVPICRSPSTRPRAVYTGRGALSISRRHESLAVLVCPARVAVCHNPAHYSGKLCRLRHITSRAFTITHIAAGAQNAASADPHSLRTQRRLKTNSSTGQHRTHRATAPDWFRGSSQSHFIETLFIRRSCSSCELKTEGLAPGADLRCRACSGCCRPSRCTSLSNVPRLRPGTSPRAEKAPGVE